MTLSEIYEGNDIFLINAMKEAKEKQLERRNEAVRKGMPRGSVKPLTPVADSEAGKGGYLRPVNNIQY